MKIVHICLCGPYTDEAGYQENLLSKYHSRMGNEVTIIASHYAYGNNGELLYQAKNEYYNNDGVKIVRSELFWGKPLGKFKKYKNIIRTLKIECPDIIFIHGCQFIDMFSIYIYLRKRQVRTYIDNHVDLYNGATNWISYYVLHKIIWKRTVKTLDPYVNRYYGVTPARVAFLSQMYKLNPAKCSLLLMGGDDELIEKIEKEKFKYNRECFGLSENDFIIVTGGKINRYRPEVINLIKAVKRLDISNVKLLIFGSVIEEYKDEFTSICDDSKILYVGWISSEMIYRCMSIASLVFFPGLHSVLWEQAVAMGKPCIFRKLEGFMHVDIGGNCIFISDVSDIGIINILNKILSENSLLDIMSTEALSERRKCFWYSNIAAKSVE